MSIPFFSDPRHQPFAFGPGPGTILLLHGFPGTPAELRPLAEWLADGGWHTTAPLLPGLGPQIHHLAETRVADWVAAAQETWRDVAGAARRAGQPAGLVGYSLGGALALTLAAATPPDFLILLAPFWRLNSWLDYALPVAPLLLPTLRPFAKANFDDPALREGMATLGSDIDLDDDAVQSFLREEFVVRSRLLSDIRRLGRRAYRGAATISVPTIIFQGRQDDVVAPVQTRRLLQRLAGPVSYLELDVDHRLPHALPSLRSLLTAPLQRFLAQLDPLAQVTLP
jgi:carboxylesterase